MLRSFSRKARKLFTFFCMTRYRPSLTPPSPTHIEIEPTTRCNATCGTCSRSSLNPQALKNDLSLATLDRILTELPDIQLVRLIGLGETFLHPDIENILKRLKAKNIKVWTITNGSLLHDDNVRRLIHQYIHEVGISIDSTRPEDFARIRPMGKIGLPDVISGAQKLIAERDQGFSDVIIGIHNTTTAENYQDLPNLGTLCIRLCVDYLAIGFAENWLVRGDPRYQETAHALSQSLPALPAIKRTVQKQQWRLALRGIPVGYKLPTKRLGRCPWPYRSVHITAGGYATPCCARTQPGHAMFNINTDNFINEWHGSQYQALRLAHMNKDELNTMCGNCPL
jgi:MoaA/NifB/PqqE/SkfB family radical SAM enzyme